MIIYHHMAIMLSNANSVGHPSLQDQQCHNWVRITLHHKREIVTLWFVETIVWLNDGLATEFFSEAPVLVGSFLLSFTRIKWKAIVNHGHIAEGHFVAKAFGISPFANFELVSSTAGLERGASNWGAQNLSCIFHSCIGLSGGSEESRDNKILKFHLFLLFVFN